MDCSVEGKIAFADGHSYHFATVDDALAFAECVKQTAQPAQCAARHGSTQSVQLEKVKLESEEKEEEQDREDRMRSAQRPSGG